MIVATEFMPVDATEANGERKVMVKNNKLFIKYILK